MIYLCKSHGCKKKKKIVLSKCSDTLTPDWNSAWHLDVKSWNDLNENGQKSACRRSYSLSAVVSLQRWRCYSYFLNAHVLCFCWWSLWIFFSDFVFYISPETQPMPHPFVQILLFNQTCLFFHSPFISATFPKPVHFYMCIHTGPCLTQARTWTPVSVFNHWL